MARLLIDRGADLSIQATIPGHCERPDDILRVTPLAYAQLFPGTQGENETVNQLRAATASLSARRDLAGRWPEGSRYKSP